MIPIRMRSNGTKGTDSGGFESPAGHGGRDWFRTTQWIDLLQAKNKEESGLAREGLTRIYENYWPPLYAYLRRSGYTRADAEDLAQGFFEHLLSQDWLKNVQPGQGKFRSFLLKALKNFCANAHARARAEKRGGKEVFIPLEEVNREEEQVFRGSDHLTPEETFDRRWAESLMARAIKRLEAEYAHNGKGNLYCELKNIENGTHCACTYAEIGVRVALSEGAVKTAIHRMRARLSKILRLEIQATVRDPSEVDDELRCLREALGH